MGKMKGKRNEEQADDITHQCTRVTRKHEMAKKNTLRDDADIMNGLQEVQISFN